jgi:Pyridine nucleotide-disulphide oxidoreductase, dimerisation domain
LFFCVETHALTQTESPFQAFQNVQPPRSIQTVAVCSSRLKRSVLRSVPIFPDVTDYPHHIVQRGERRMVFSSPPVDAEILGASLLGTECDEVIHSILDVMYAKAPYTVIQRAMHIHPTVTELIPTMLGELKPLV